MGRDTSTPTKALDAKAAEISAAPTQPAPVDGKPETSATTGGKPSALAKRPPPAQRAMSVQQRKLEGIKLAKAKAARDKTMGGAPEVRRKKVDEVGKGDGKEKGEGKAEVNGAG